MADRSDLAPLLPYCTETQARYLKAIMEYGSLRKATAALGVNARTVTYSLSAVRKKAAKAGYAPEHDMTRTVPEGFAVAGVSTLYDGDGVMRAQWVKSRAEVARLEAIKEMIDGIAEPFTGLAKPARKPKKTTGHMLTVYPMGDPHVGMYAYHAETGADFDLSIAERNLCGAVDRLVAVAPASEQAVIINVGDYYHSDTADNRTQASGHALDVDTRWTKVLHVGIRAMRRCIESALLKHARVRVINAAGNHDHHTSAVLSAVLDAFYENEPRVDVDMSPAAHRYHEFGRCLIGVAHGDRSKPESLGPIMASDQYEAWGRTEHRYWYTGHVHHRRVFELPGCLVESFRTLAPRDAWHSAQGYRSGRDMYCIVLHEQHGEIERHRVDVGALVDLT